MVRIRLSVLPLASINGSCCMGSKGVRRRSDLGRALASAWVQSSDDSFNCRKALLGELAALEVEPMGYGDRGRVIM